MFCGSASAASRVGEVGHIFTLGEGVLYVAQYDVRAQVLGTLFVRAAILHMPPRPEEGYDIYSWPEVARQVVAASVRILVGNINNKDLPLIAELSKLISTNTLTTGANPEFPICLLGEVGLVRGLEQVVQTFAVADGEYLKFPRIPSITVRTPEKDVEKTVKRIISVNGTG